MKGTFCGRRLSVLCGIAAAGILAPAAAIAAPPVTGVLPAVPAAAPNVVPVTAPAAPALPAVDPSVAKAADTAKAVATTAGATTRAVVKTVAAKTKLQPRIAAKFPRNWKPKIVVRVRMNMNKKRLLSNGGGDSAGGVIQTCVPRDGWMVCRGIPFAGDLINTCYKNEVVAVSGTITMMSKVAVDPIRQTVTTYQTLDWVGVKGVGSLGNKYNADDLTVEWQRQKTFTFGTGIWTGRQETQSLVSSNRGVTDQYLFIKTFTTVIVSANPNEPVYVDVDIRGPGITCVNDRRDCDSDYDDGWGKHDRDDHH
jgi:hypothetical protein